MGGVAIEEFVTLKRKMYLVLVINFCKYKKGKSVNKMLVAKISRNEYKGVLLNKNSK